MVLTKSKYRCSILDPVNPGGPHLAICFQLIFVFCLINPTNVIGKGSKGLFLCQPDGSNIIVHHCSYLQDSLGLDINNVQQYEFLAEFVDDMHWSSDPIWIKWTVVNQTETEEFLLTIDQWQYAELYQEIDSGKFKFFKSGTLLPVKDRPESLHRLISYPLHQRIGDTTEYYLRVHNPGKMIKRYASYFNFLAKMEWEPASIGRAKFVTNQVFISFVLGACFILFIYNVIILFGNFRWEVLWLSLYVMITAVFFANIHGLTTNYFLTEFQGFELPMGTTFYRLVAIFSGLYIVAFLSIKKTDFQFWLMSLYFITQLVFLVLVPVSDSLLVWFFTVRITEIAILSIVLSIALWKKQSGAWILTIAIFSSVMGQFFAEILSHHLGIFVRGDLPYVFGQLLQIILFTWGSTVNYKKLESELREAQRKNEQILKDQNVKLNQLVDKRTIDLKNQSEDLRNSYNKLQELDQYKESMTGMIVHDFKNSLNTVISFSDGKPTERRLKSIKQAGQFMLNMVMNILDVQKFEEANVRLSLANYTLLQIANDAVDQLSYMIDQKSVNLSIKGNLESICRVDYELILRTIVNILSNAIKYVSMNGNITIELEEEREHIKLWIKDDGVGIPADKLDLVFDKYAQVDAKKSGVVRSTGLGLTFCKLVVEAHGGSIGVESVEGEGSSFYFTVPAVEQEIIGKENDAIEVSRDDHEVKCQLSIEQKTLLKPILEDLQQWEVYDYSEVMTILDDVDLKDAPIREWKDEVVSALHNVNENKFNELIRL